MHGVLLGCPCSQAPAAENAEVFYTRTDLTPAQTPRAGLILERHSANGRREISTHCTEGIRKNTLIGGTVVDGCSAVGKYKL